MRAGRISRRSRGGSGRETESYQAISIIMVFDCVYVNGHALFGRPLEERQHIMQELRPALASDAVKLTEPFPATQSRRLMEACAAMGLEGVIMKRKRSLYRPAIAARTGSRSPSGTQMNLL